MESNWLYKLRIYQSQRYRLGCGSMKNIILMKTLFVGTVYFKENFMSFWGIDFRTFKALSWMVQGLLEIPRNEWSLFYIFFMFKKKHPSFIIVRDFDDIHQHISFSKVKILAIRPCRTLHKSEKWAEEGTFLAKAICNTKKPVYCH